MAGVDNFVAPASTRFQHAGVVLALKPVFSIQVRTLVEFAWRTGDLGGESDFTGPRRALAGIRGHQKVQRSRPAAYQREVKLRHELELEAFTLRIIGRIDGLLPGPDGCVLEEIKTVQRSWDGKPDPLHWAQAKIYGFIYAQQNDLNCLELQLTYLNLDTGKLTQFCEACRFPELNDFFERTAAIYLEWLHLRHEWCRLRDLSIQSFGFPFSRYRPGQRKLAVAAYRALVRGGRLFIEAPTGIGKTISVLFPSVKALHELKLDRIFYLTARTPGREVALKAIAEMRQAGLKLKALALTAKEKLCIQDGHPCDKLACPLALGYYDRVKGAMREALTHEQLDRSLLEQIGHAYQVCPFELSLDLSSWVDAVICDYNYVFDPQVYLRRHFSEDAGPHIFLVDEAHNLVERAREMFSAELHNQDIATVKKAVQPHLPACGRALGKLQRTMREILGRVETSSLQSEDSDSSFGPDLFTAPSPGVKRPTTERSLTKSVTGSSDRSPIRIIHEAPAAMFAPLESALAEAERWLARNEPSNFRQDLLELYFQLYSFKRTAEQFDEHYVTLVEGTRDTRLRLYCLDPSRLLQEAMKRGYATLCFSATLTPLDYYQSLLGGEAEDPVLRLSSPFPPDNLAVLVHGGIRTDLKSRGSTLRAVVEAIAAFVAEKEGNYLVYFPSYLYLTAVLDQVRELLPELQVRVQQPRMSEAERGDFLAAFAVTHSRTLVGFALMGGVFGEAIDLVGDRLIGAIIVGVGLPQLCVERDLIRHYFQNKSGAGFEYAYMFPGLTRVLQATGRVIRSEADKGAVLLIDQRFREGRYQRAFPVTWRPVLVNSAQEIGTVVRQFWQRKGTEAKLDEP